MGSSASAAQHAAGSIVKYPRILIVDGVVNPTGLAAGQTLGVPLTIPGDADFEWWWIAAFRTSNQLKLAIAESGSGRSFMYGTTQNPSQQGLFIDLLAGLTSQNAAFPIAVPYVMPASRTYQHNFTDLSGAANTVELAFHGFALLHMASGS